MATLQRRCLTASNKSTINRIPPKIIAIRAVPSESAIQGGGDGGDGSMGGCGGCGGVKGGFGGLEGDCAWDLQSVQSEPKSQSAKIEPGPPSSQNPSAG
eukprot:414733-Prymnesium_polylepis.1